MHFQHIITTLRKFDPNFNESEINSAITFSLKCSNNNIPREIAEIITSIYPDSNSVIAALWFFIIENNNLKSIKIEHFFSKEIFDIFYALTKLFKIHNIYSDVTSQKTIRLLSSLDSNIKIKVLLIRFAYLLHKIIFNSNISHIEYVWISKEISKIYVPLFKEIKVEKIKVALQNACFKNLHPRLYKTIISFLDREYLHYELVAQIIDAFHNVLPATNIEYTISGRIKSPYSIAKKIVHKSSTIQQLYDIIGIRIIVEKEQECYDILGTIYKHYAYIPERYKNLIKFPRKNGYQSLHTVIINKDLRKIEVQIRTKIMHYIAEYGTASHSQYKMGLNISNIAYNILNRLILNQLTIIPILHGRIGDKVYAQLLTNEVSRDVLVQQLLNINLENKTFINDKVPDIIDEWNDNLPLHDAVKSGCKDIIELLLPQSTDVNILDQHHKTPLHYVTASRQFRANTSVNIRTNEISSNPLESLDLDIEQESNNANDSGIVESDVEDEDYTTFNPTRASTPVNIRTNEISSNPLESLDLDIEQESNNANDSGIVESDVEDEDYTTFNPTRASTPVNIRTNEISSNPLESLDLDIEQESNNANDSGIVESDVEDEDYTTFNPTRASTPVNIRTNEISSNPLESLDLDIEQESNNANDSGIVESDVEDEDYTTFNPTRASTPVNIRTNEISSNPLESLDLDIEQESNNANDSGIVESDVEDEDYTTFNPTRASTPVNIRTNEISSNPLESLDLDIEQESNNANDSGIVESDVEDEDYTTFNPTRASTPVNIRTNEISSNPLESLDLDIEQESNNANDSGIVESDVEDEDYTTFNPTRASTPVNIRTNEISTCINSTVDGILINLANLPNLVGTSLDLSNKLLDDKDIEYLFKILLPETCITSLNLSNNILVCGKVNGIRYLTHLLNTRIASLNLSNNRLGQLPQEDIEHFISILPNTQITSLNLSNNQLTCQHLKYFAHTLPKTNIMLLDLSNNSLGGEEDMEDFINILSKTKITSLNLSDNNLDDADIYNLADILPNSRITNINLSYNDVTPDLHNEILIDALQQSPLITRFDIDDELLFSKANTIINQNQENNKNLFSIFNKIVCKDNNNLTLIKKGTIEVDEYFFVIKHLIKTTNVLYLLSTQYQINNTKMWFTEEELINFIQRIPSEFRELMTLLDCQVTTQVNVLQKCEKNDMSEVVKELLLARELYKTNKEKNILHEYVYILLSKYELPIIHDGMCNNPSREDLIHHFQSNDYQENQEAQYVVSLLGNGL